MVILGGGGVDERGAPVPQAAWQTILKQAPQLGNEIAIFFSKEPRLTKLIALSGVRGKGRGRFGWRWLSRFPSSATSLSHTKLFEGCLAKVIFPTNSSTYPLLLIMGRTSKRICAGIDFCNTTSLKPSVRSVLTGASLCNTNITTGATSKHPNQHDANSLHGPYTIQVYLAHKNHPPPPRAPP